MRALGFWSFTYVFDLEQNRKTAHTTTSRTDRDAAKASYEMPVWKLIPQDDYLIAVEDDRGVEVAYGSGMGC